MERKVGVAVSAMILAAQLGSPLAADEPTLDQLAEIVSFLGNDDAAALREYLLAHPELLEGDTTLALLLRRFMDDTSNATALFSFPPDLADAIGRSDTFVPEPDTGFEAAAGEIY